MKQKLEATAEQIDFIRGKIDCMTKKCIYETLEINPAILKRWMGEYGIIKTKQPQEPKEKKPKTIEFSQYDLQLIIDKYANWGTKKLAEKLNVSRTTVDAKAVELGIKPPRKCDYKCGRVQRENNGFFDVDSESEWYKF